ncbi:hypothetical protein BX666DRAFT_1874264 [Dichotomocladium elegans]|nr:hypothetical protein BX666DRAFT_1874264 [Dichotomocladium elegans]
MIKFGQAVFIRTIVSAALLLSYLASADVNPGGFYGGCVLVKNETIYCYGGNPSAMDEFGGSSNFYSLNVSVSLTADSSTNSWQKVTPKGNGPGANGAFGIAALPNKDFFVMTGGGGSDTPGAEGANNPSIHNGTFVFDTITNTFTRLPDQYPSVALAPLVPNIATGEEFFLYGGWSFHSYTGYANASDGSNGYPVQPKFLRLSSATVVANISYWSYGYETAKTNVSGRTRHAIAQATSGFYYIFGGEVQTPNIIGNNVQYTQYPPLADMRSLLVYDAINGWYSVNTTGDIPTPRVYATATTLNNGKILMYGGGPANSSYTLYNALPDFAYLFDPTANSWTNLTDTIAGKAGPNATSQNFARQGHSAVLVGNDLFIFFGSGINPNSVTAPPTLANYLILDTNTWTMTNSHTGANGVAATPDAPTEVEPTPSPNQDQNGGLSGGAIAGVVIGVVAVVRR